MIAYDAGLNLRTVIEINRGTFVSSDIHLPSLLGAVMAAGAERFVLAHNHPSNDPNPTAADVQATSLVIEAAKLCGLWCEDHWIVTPSGRWTSMVGLGLMDHSSYAAIPSVQGATP